jgi:hypothetical protein
MLIAISPFLVIAIDQSPSRSHFASTVVIVRSVDVLVVDISIIILAVDVSAVVVIIIHAMDVLVVFLASVVALRVIGFIVSLLASLRCRRWCVHAVVLSFVCALFRRLASPRRLRLVLTDAL